MKKLISVILALWLPIMLLAQPMDTTTIYFENFNGGTPNVTFTNMFESTGDWKANTTYFYSSPKSFYSPVYSTSGASTMYLASIPLSSPNMTDAVRKVYLDFDHICKVSQLDEAYIYYRKASSLDFTGQPNWSNPQKLTFTQSSPCYLSSPAGVFDGAAGQFSDACYDVWTKSSVSAVPNNNTWWRHEFLDLSSFLIDGNTQYVELQFRVNKSSPSTSGTQACKGWFVDNIKVRLSNCELIKPTITMMTPYYMQSTTTSISNNTLNNIGPYTINAKLFDNDTIKTSSIKFSYQVFPYQMTPEALTVVPNTITSNTFAAAGNTVLATWEVPSICYLDTVRYHIYTEDVHGSVTSYDTFFVARHNQTNINTNDCRLDSLDQGGWPHCFISGTNQPVNLYFTNKSDAAHSIGGAYQTALNVTFKVNNENGVTTHNTTHSWTGSLCFDERSNMSLGTFQPTKGWNYLTVYVNQRNGQADGYHANDTLHYAWYSCDSLLSGDYTVGGPNADFPNMKTVKDNLEYCGLSGPVTFHLRPGTYQDFDFQKTYNGQSEVNTITFVGDNRDNVIVVNNRQDSSAAAFYYGAVTLVNVKDYRFKNLTIQGKQQPVSRAVAVRGNGTTNVIFENCKIVANPTNTVTTTSYAVGRETSATSVPDTIVFRNCIMEGGNFGVYYVGNTKSGNNKRQNSLTIENCQVKSCYRGIYAKYSLPLTLKSNHISQYPMSSHQNFSGIYVEYAANADFDGNTIDSVYKAEYGICAKNLNAEGFYIRNNHVKVGDSQYGIYLNASSSTATDTGFVYNNEVILYPVTAAASYAMQLNTAMGLKLTNNSLYVKSDAPYNNTAALHIMNSTNNNITYFNNNILINECNSSDNTNYALYLNNTSKVVGAYNNLYSASSTVAYTTTPKSSISDFEAAMTTCTNSISMLPPMANATNSLLPTDFTGMECPRNVVATKDIRNTNRTALTYMGAYANPIAAIDASVTALLVPSVGDCPQNTYNVMVSVANKGSEVLNFAAHNATITMHSDSLNLTRTRTINSGTIAVLGSASELVANNIAIPVNQPIDLTFIIRTSGDNNYLNDTLTIPFVMEVARPDYEEDFSNGTTQQSSWSCIPEGDNRGNWTFQSGTYGTPAIAPVYGTGVMYFNSKNASYTANTKALAVMPVVQLNNSVNPIMEMWFAHDNATPGKDVEGVIVKVSTDGGTTYTAIHPTDQTANLVKRYKQTATTPEWQRYEYDLGSYVSSGCIYIAFEAISSAQHGGDIHIDRVRLRNRYNNDVAVTQIYSQGETPTKYQIKDVVSALVRNEGAQTQTNVKVYLTVSGATETYRDTVIIPSLASNAQKIVRFADHVYSTNEVKNVEVRSLDDQNNNNNAMNVRMVTNNNLVNYADTSSFVQKTGDYTNVIRPCVRYKTNQELVVTDVKYYYDQTYIANPERGFKAFVSNAAGQILATSDVIPFNTLQQGAWNIIPIQNYALTNMQNEIYVGIEMLANGDYLCSQVETPLRDSAFYYLESNGTYTPQTFGRFMIGAVVDTPHVHDFAILSMNNPTTRCDLGHEHIVLTITNNGSQDILPGMQLHYSINGAAPVTETMTNTLHSHETTNFTFNTIYDFSNHQVNIDDNYNVVVWVTKDNGDRLQFNDTIKQTIVSLGKSPLPIVSDTVNVSYYTSGTINASLPASIQQGVLGWYTNSGYESWNFLEYNTAFTTPVTFFDTTYYVTANPGYIYNTVIGTGKGTTVNPNAIVSDEKSFVFASPYSKGRMLYTQNEIGNYGPITRIGFYVTVKSTNTQGFPVKLYLKETQLNTLPTAQIDWNNEILDATLVVDELLMPNDTGWYYFNLPTPFDYTSGNLMILTETNSGAASSGTPKFQSTTIANMVQYKNGNAAAMTGNYTAYGKRLNLSVQISELQCGSEKAPVVVHVPNIPIYDVETISFDYPTTSCALYDEHIKVTLKNNLNMPIPASKVVAHAKFNGQVISQVINEPFASEEVKQVTFDNTFDFATHNHANETFNYVVYTDMPSEAVVYRGNDTITGSFTSTRTAQFPRNPIVYTGAYTQPYTVLEPEDRPTNTNGTTEITQWRYYADSLTTTALTPLPTTANPTYTTPALYDTTVVWVEAKTQTSNCMTRRTPIYINVRVPQHDLITKTFVSPSSYQCGLNANQNVVVRVGNTDQVAANTIPANTFNVTGRFADGSHVITDTKPVTAAIHGKDSANVTLTLSNFASTTQNYSYNYSIYSKPVNTTIWTYTHNDTISGMLYVPANPVAPSPLTYTVPYGTTKTVTPTGLNYYYFYTSNSASAVPFAQGTSFTTDPIYNTTTLYYSGRIEDPNFVELVTVGTASTANAAPFNFNSVNGRSYAKILYNVEDLGGNPGTIDSIYVDISVANTSGVGLPVKIWLKNGPNVEYLAAAPALNWDTETNSAVLIFDGDLAFDQVGRYSIPINGRFDYTGGALYMYVEHDCGTASCITGMGVIEPKFKNTTYSATNQKRILQKSGNAVSFSLGNLRWNTIFKFNYTCQSPKASITINTTQPQKDVGVIAITAPTTPGQYTNNETVTVTIKNYGSTAASNFPVSYRLANGTPVTENYTGSLAAGATGTKTFTAHADLSSVYFDTEFCAYTSLSGDNTHVNDTICMNLNVGDACISRPQSLATGLDIANVNFAGINNGNGITAPSSYTNYTPEGDGMYTDYSQTVPPGEIVKGQTYPMSITHAFESASAAGSIYKKVYIDYDRDGEFSANELVFSTNAMSSAIANATTTTTITIPESANEGLTCMRVICSATNVNSPCVTYNSAGETEDYSLRISPAKSVDLGVVEILHPNGNVCQDTAANIKIRVKNFGSENQSFTPTNALTVTATITGTNAGTYVGTVNSGSLASGETMTVEIPNVNINALGTFTVLASLSYPNDMLDLNDTMTASANTNSLGLIVSGVDPLFSDDFDHNTGITDLHFNGTYWAGVTGSDTLHYKWVVNQGESPNNPTNFGPIQDHTNMNQPTADYGRYAMVEGKTGTTNYTKWTAMTSKCLNLHKQNEYPIELSFFKYIYAPSTANDSNTELDLKIEVGSGNDFVLVDTLSFANSRNLTQNWERHVSIINDYDAVAQLRFTLMHHKNKIDPAIDDILLGPGYPDLEVVDFVYPTDGFDDCLTIGDSVAPVIIIRNNGFSSVNNYNLQVVMSVGTRFDTIRDEHIALAVPAGDTIHYRMNKSFFIHHNFRPVQFRADLEIALDRDPENNYMTIVTCTNSDVEDYAEENGVGLKQNEPNPAYDETRIGYTLPDYGKANISIYSSLGQLLYSQDQESVKGDNFMDVSVANLSAGVYYYTLTFKDVMITKKMVVQK